MTQNSTPPPPESFNGLLRRLASESGDLLRRLAVEHEREVQHLHAELSLLQAEMGAAGIQRSASSRTPASPAPLSPEGLQKPTHRSQVLPASTKKRQARLKDAHGGTRPPHRSGKPDENALAKACALLETITVEDEQSSTMELIDSMTAAVRVAEPQQLSDPMPTWPSAAASREGSSQTGSHVDPDPEITTPIPRATGHTLPDFGVDLPMDEELMRRMSLSPREQSRNATQGFLDALTGTDCRDLVGVDLPEANGAEDGAGNAADGSINGDSPSPPRPSRLSQPVRPRDRPEEEISDPSMLLLKYGIARESTEGQEVAAQQWSEENQRSVLLNPWGSRLEVLNEENGEELIEMAQPELLDAAAKVASMQSQPSDTSEPPTSLTPQNTKTRVPVWPELPGEAADERPVRPTPVAEMLNSVPVFLDSVSKPSESTQPRDQKSSADVITEEHTPVKSENQDPALQTFAERRALFGQEPGLSPLLEASPSAASSGVLGSPPGMELLEADDLGASCAVAAEGGMTVPSTKQEDWRSLLQVHGKKWRPDGDDGVSIGMYLDSPQPAAPQRTVSQDGPEVASESKGNFSV